MSNKTEKLTAASVCREFGKSWKRFVDAGKPLFEELHNRISFGDAWSILRTNKQADYTEKLDRDLKQVEGAEAEAK